MKPIYLDSLAALNAAVDYLLLLAAGKLCALPLRRGRIAGAAALGGVYAVLCALWPQRFALVSLKLFVGCALVLLAYGVHRRALRAILCFFAVGAAFAGAVYAALGLTGGGEGALLPVSLPALVLSFALCYAAVSLVFRRVGTRGERQMHTLALEWDGRHVSCTALRDSGNELTDPLSGEPVAVVECAVLEALFPAEEVRTALRADAFAALEALSAQYPGRFRLLPCSCVAAEQALLLCFRPDAAAVDGRAAALRVALSPQPLSADGEYQAII